MGPDFGMGRLFPRCAPPHIRRGATSGLALVVLLAPRLSLADDGGDHELSGALSETSLVAGLSSWLPMRPVGHFRPAGHQGGGPHGGVFIGIDTGLAVSLPAGTDPAERSLTFGARTGYEFPNGLALQLRYDYLGVAPHLTSPPTSGAQIGSVGVRYSIPFLFPLPFFEAMWGPAFNGAVASVAGGLGVGASFPIGRHVRVDVSARDWVMPIDGHVRQIFTFTLGSSVSFASPGR